MANEFGPTLERLGVLRDLGEPPRIMNPTYRDRAISATAPVMQWWQSLSPASKELTESQAKAQALKSTKRIFGDIEAENIMDSLGILDFTPAGLVFAGQEAYREFGEAEKPTDYILPTVGLGLSGLEAYPLTKPLVSTATRPLRRFLSNLSSKTSEPIDVGRRKVVGGIAATPIVAGALSQIPLGKVEPIIEKVVPKNFNIFDLSSFKERFEDDVFTMFRENAYFYDKDEMSEIILDAFDEKELIDMGMDPKNLGEAEFTDDRIVKRLYPDDPNIPDQSEVLESYASETETLNETDNIIFEMKQELKRKFPDSSPSEIDKQFDFLNLENLESPYAEGASRESVENKMKKHMKEKFGDLYEDPDEKLIVRPDKEISLDADKIRVRENILSNPETKMLIEDVGINELNSITSREFNKYKDKYPNTKINYKTFKQIVFESSGRFDFKNTNLKKPRKFDSLTDANKQKIYDMSKDSSVDQDNLQDIVDELREEEKFWGAG
jgi:hypothetical protein